MRLHAATPTLSAWRYHARTKHHFDRFAASAGRLDWATQPDPFRRWDGAPWLKLPYRSAAPAVTWDDLAARGRVPPEALTLATLGDVLRHALGLSAWKQAGGARWALRVNPSSGNLHPTEGWVVVPALRDIADGPALLHYDAERHGAHLRAHLPGDAWAELMEGTPAGAFLVGLSSVAWREAWKYGERAFRYCLHDTGHALAALSIAAAMMGWRLRVLSGWATDDVAALLGLDRAGDLHADEPEEAQLVALVHREDVEPASAPEPGEALRRLVTGARWHGTARRLSAHHAASWPVVDAAAVATRIQRPSSSLLSTPPPPPSSGDPPPPRPGLDARRLVLQRRSAVDLDGSSWTTREAFVRMLRRALPAAGAPWDALALPPRIHLALFAHRVSGLPPGLHGLVRTADAAPLLREQTRSSFAWTRPDGVPETLPLFLLEAGDVRRLAMRVSCDQEIAGDGFFSLGMLAELDAALAARGPHAYRELFWESGIVGQVLYLEAEAATAETGEPARATGIGCFHDDPVHHVLGIPGTPPSGVPPLQSIYHFTVGVPVDDPRIMTRPPYADEA
jgi:SagB-type dehydrogenase family enzyme